MVDILYASCYNCFMSSKSLCQTNPYLRDPINREYLITRSAATSSGVEGIDVSKLMTTDIKITQRKPKKIYNKAK